jgi:hypothetical protein
MVGEEDSEANFNQLATHLNKYDYQQRGIVRYMVVYTSYIAVYGTTTHGRDSRDK